LLVVSSQLSGKDKRQKESGVIKSNTEGDVLWLKAESTDALYRELSGLKTCLNRRFTLMKMMTLIKTF
jgi:hypothetical protein